MKKVIGREKKCKTRNEVKPAEDINKDLHTFLEISPMQKKVLPLYKLQDHAYE